MYVRLKNKLNAARQLSISDWQMFIKIWCMLLLVDLRLRVSPFANLQRWAAEISPASVTTPYQTEEDSIRNLYLLVDIASRNHLYPMTCLRRSLTLQRILSKRSIQTELRFGVQKAQGELSAHAWLEYAGKPIGEPETLTGQYITLVGNQTKI